MKSLIISLQTRTVPSKLAIREYQFSARGKPKETQRTRQNLWLIAAKGDGSQHRFMARQGFADESARFDVENTDEVVRCRSDDFFIVWGPIDASEIPVVVLQNVEHALPRRDVPYGDRTIVACGCKIAAIWGIRYPIYLK